MLAQSILVCTIAAVARAQSASSVAAVTGKTTVSQVMPAAATQAFLITNTTSTEQFNWCHAQLITCPQICGGSAQVNQCNPATLTYSCLCFNGTVPDCTAFKETLPFYICQATYGQCINAHPNDAQGQQTCKDNEVCGTRNATAEAAAQSSAAAGSASTAAASSASGSATAASTASSSAAATSKGAAVANSQNMATGATAAILLAAMKLFF